MRNYKVGDIIKYYSYNVDEIGERLFYYSIIIDIDTKNDEYR